MKSTRRSYNPEDKLEAVIEMLRGEKSVAQICRERGIKDSLVYKWKQQFEARASSIFEGRQPSVESSKDAKIAELGRIIGQLTVENTILKKAKSLLESEWWSNG